MERTAESQTDQALQILVDAGLPEQDAIQIKQFVMQSSLQTQNQAKPTAKVPAAPSAQTGG
jgi:hypothetical protein